MFKKTRDYLRKLLLSKSDKDIQEFVKSYFAQRHGYGECLSTEQLIQTFFKIYKNCPKGLQPALKDLAPDSHSQLLQDLFVISELGELRNQGTFIEFGATNGVDLSNSWLLEKKLGWRGILAEPARCWHEALEKNRQSKIETQCIWSKTGETLTFNETQQPELSSLDKFADGDMHSHDRTTAKNYSVNTISLNDLFIKHQLPSRIDYLSIDTEGSEYEILEAFDFKKFSFKVITCEHNYSVRRNQIYDLLTKHGYQRKYTELSLFDDWYVLPVVV